MDTLKEFHGPNAGYVLELYDRYRRNPEAVDAKTRAYFEHWSPPTNGAESLTGPTPAFDKIVGAVNLAQAVREYGHLAAQLDPLGNAPPGDPSLELSYYGLSEADLRQLPGSLIGGPIAATATDTWQAIAQLRQVYSSNTGYDYDHVRVPEEREWLRQAAESRRFHPPADPINVEALLDRLTQVEVFERFLHRTFPGKTRFSIEGLDMMVPILDEIIGAAAEDGIYTILLGMAHRGRLNVLAHVLNKPYSQILAEFKDPIEGHGFFVHKDLGWTGDVKYHSGGQRSIEGGQAVDLVVSMAPNPSHLESVNPVIEGMARAAGTYVDQAGPPRFEHLVSLPVLIHGDAAFPGQGVVAETLNLSRLPGYLTGGTIHLIANNQLGYTTLPQDGRSTLYASDLAKGFKIPIVHVNADDPEACVEVARLAAAYRAKFQKDFLIDLIGYRRYGHNEGDEPRFTQPVVYQKIETHPTVRQQWAERLAEREVIDPEQAEALVETKTNELQALLEALKPEEALDEPEPTPPPSGAARRIKTTVPLPELQALNEALLTMPQGFNLNRKLKRVRQRRQEIFEQAAEATIDWGTAEELAFASILADGTAIRLTGQDVERGTFSHRHVVFHDEISGLQFTPLQAIPQAQAAFEVHNSPLTENTAIGFEFGYNVERPERLVIWEAQYGDFINAAQITLDEFLVSARAKWGQTPSLVLLLPHGYEGQGPDHSTGRLERFLQMAAETNMRIANCTTAAQYFHLLRRQAGLLKTDPLPLIVMTPKSLLRHPKVTSTPSDFSQGHWQPVIDDAQARQNPAQVRRLILCSGKIFIDLISAEQRQHSPELAIVRMEQLYPFPAEDLKEVLNGYPNLESLVWVQEEPRNMGAWTHMQLELRSTIGEHWPLYYLGRPRSSSPAGGSLAWHNYSQAVLIDKAYDPTIKATKTSTIIYKKA